MEYSERYFVLQSIQDVINILHGQPVGRDIETKITIVKAMNRMSIAHLSIERALKFLITEAGGTFDKDHDLPSRLEELQRHDSEAAGFLEEAFEDAVQHYRYNPNQANMGHLRSLKEYLRSTGSLKTFQTFRYWELTQSPDERVLRQINLLLHVELLYALREILSNPNGSRKKPTDRVEKAARDASVGSAWAASDTESRDLYIGWIRGHGSIREAMAAAVKADFKVGDAYAEKYTKTAYRKLTESSDPAVRYFANTLDVLPTQPRDVIPDVEWLGPEKERLGRVSAPDGTYLGSIERYLDGLWYIEPAQGGLGGVSAKARSQTDARCYLATLLSRPAKVKTDSGERDVRIVGEESDIFGEDYLTEGIYRVTFWDENHGIREGGRITIETRAREGEGISDVLEGTVVGTTGSEVTISGMESKRHEGNPSIGL